MIVLIGFALLAGAGTALSPCVLPVLPALRDLAIAILANLDVNFDQFVAERIPDVNLTAVLECSSTGVTGYAFTFG